MAGALDSLFKNVAKQVVADLGKSFDHTITLKYAGSNRVAQITDIRTFKGDQEYFFTIQVRF